MRGVDVNPNNIFISGLEGEVPVVKLADLGMGELHQQAGFS